MTILPITQYHKSLKKLSEEERETVKLLITQADIYADPTIHTELANDMLETVRAYHARGLATNQVGSLVRMVVVEVEGTLTLMLNPVIDKVGDREIGPYEEGCLSFPGASTKVPRPDSVVVTYNTLEGDSLTELITGSDVSAVLHELEHLDGILIVHKLAGLAKRNFLRKVEKFQKRFKRPVTLKINE